jgi:hypothetical protein
MQMLNKTKKYFLRIYRKLHFDSFLYFLVTLTKKNKNANFFQLNDSGYMDVKHLFVSKDVRLLFDLLEKNGSPFGSKSDFWDTYSTDFVEYPQSIKNSIKYFLKEIKELNGSEFRFDYGLLTINKHNPDSRDLLYSQNFHFDYDSARVYKIFIFLDQVKLNDGPFQFFTINESKKFKLVNIFKYGISDEFIRKKHLGHPRLLLNEHDDLLAFAVNTRECLHCGGRVEPGGFRKMLTLAFLSK